MKISLVVLSGGQDSTTCLFWAGERLNRLQGDRLHAVTFDYGQRHAIEIEAARKVAELAYVDSHEVIAVPNCLRSASPLVDFDNELERYTDFEQMDKVIGNRVELTFVPMRNTLFLTVAANRLVQLASEFKEPVDLELVTGVCQEDNANYPDCRESYIYALENAFNQSLGFNRLRIVTPLMHLSKAQTVRMMHELGTHAWNALAYTHTSYDGKYPPTDMNHSNVLRAEGFKNAGLADPLVLRAYREGLMELPASSNYDAWRSQE